ncbi:DUF7019 family protein [Streptomyces bambusae]|uniref:Uncharacterized protein n=1 Tax=Streptomyces bambusae TaxID=1550616 RepID=A0ABS6ZAE6_9ACTN|nr:hypothetical protein [Streptomyces bambusae]MBW5483696.1 hypothetical protein [Streptomyces bambusae]
MTTQALRCAGWGSGEDLAVGRDEAGSYLYWSDRRVDEIASDNGVTLGSRLSWTIKAAPQGIGAEVANRERASLTRREKALKIEKVIGDQAVSTFQSPPPAHFAKGVGQVNIARFIGGPERDKGAMLHVRTTSVGGRRVDLVLFGSLDNFPGRPFRPSDALDSGWFSSAWYAIAELLESRGTRNTSQWDTPELLSVEALHIALNQGSESPGTDQEAWTRGLTLAHAHDCEWFAQIYTDVVLTPGRWNFGDNRSGAHRILIGAPVWVRTASPESLIRYADLRRAAGRRPLRLASLGGRRRRGSG